MSRLPILRQLRELRTFMRDVHELLVTFLPGSTGARLRTRYYRDRLGFLGDNVRIDIGVQFTNPQLIRIADNCWIDKYVVIMAGRPSEGERLLIRTKNEAFLHSEGEVILASGCHIAPHAVLNGHGGIQIGRNVTVAAGAKIVSLSHHHLNPRDMMDTFPYRFSTMAPEAEQSLIAGPVVIQDNAGLATNAVMLPGTTIGYESWVGAGSLVSHAIPDGWIAWGLPARPMRRRLAQDAAYAHQN